MTVQEKKINSGKLGFYAESQERLLLKNLDDAALQICCRISLLEHSYSYLRGRSDAYNGPTK